MDVFKLSILIFAQFALIKTDKMISLLCSALVRGVELYHSELKEEIFCYIFDVFELVLLQFPLQQCPIVYEMTEQIAVHTLMNIEDL